MLKKKSATKLKFVSLPCSEFFVRTPFITVKLEEFVAPCRQH
jgi:hypothetical protein